MGVTISHPGPPVLVEELTVTVAAVVPLLVSEIVCGSGVVVLDWKAKFNAAGLTLTVGAAATVKFTGKITVPDEVLAVTVPL